MIGDYTIFMATYRNISAFCTAVFLYVQLAALIVPYITVKVIEYCRSILSNSNALADPQQAFHGPIEDPWTPGWEPLK